jgi:hypothetical protein
MHSFEEAAFSNRTYGNTELLAIDAQAAALLAKEPSTH